MPCSIIASGWASRWSPSSRSTTTPIVHGRTAFGGKPQRFRHIQADFNGHIAELLSKVTAQGKLDEAVTKEDQEKLLEALRSWGALDKNYATGPAPQISERRGYDSDPGGGLSARACAVRADRPVRHAASPTCGRSIAAGNFYEFQTPMFQPVGGMDMIAQALTREVGRPDPVQRQGLRHPPGREGRHGHVSGHQGWQDAKGGAPMTASADWCLCTIPLSILSQIDMNVGTRHEGRHRRRAL